VRETEGRKEGREGGGREGREGGGEREGEREGRKKTSMSSLTTPHSHNPTGSTKENCLILTPKHL
jgi:hypothetical protein